MRKTCITARRAQAEKEGTDVVICDTSGRLHTNDNLMQELLKCKRALGAPQQQKTSESYPTLRRDEGPPHAWYPSSLFHAHNLCELGC